MPKTRQQKEEIISSVSDKISRSKAAVFANFTGLNIVETNNLRKECRDNDAEYLVIKKTLFARVLDKSKISDVDVKSMDKGGVSLIVGFGDEVSPARILAKFGKGRDELVTIAGGLLEGKTIDADMVKHLAALPSKQELIAKVVGSCAAPLSGLVNVLQGNLRGLVYTLQAIREQKS